MNNKKYFLYNIVCELFFYLCLFSKDTNNKLLEIDNILSGNTILYFLIFILPFLFIKLLFYTMCIKYIFKIKVFLYFSIGILLYIITDHYIYIYMTSDNFQYIDYDALIRSLIRIVFLSIFYREIKIKYI
ncbi:hypothetical protein QE357_000768 [Siphonobacter sp. BAB-5404]|nr:hypothetical protein [Siphonobacter sp. SORGH_AS_0500]